MDNHIYVERADPDIKGYEEGTRRRFNVIDRYAWANRFVKGLTVDMPCGMGWGTSLLLSPFRVLGIDKSYEAIKRARNLYPHVRFEVGNMLCTYLPSNFADTLVCCEGYEHISRKDQFTLMNEIHRITKAKGIVLLTVPFAKYKGDHTGNEFHLYEPTINEVEETFIDKFEVIELIKPNVARYRLKVIK